MGQTGLPAVAHLKRALYPPSCRVTRQRPGESGEANPAGQNSYVLNRVRSGLFWLSLTVAVGFSVKIFFRRPSINRSSSAISAALLCLPPLWISSSLCINSARVSMTSSKAGALIRHSSDWRRGLLANWSAVQNFARIPPLHFPRTIRPSI